MSNFKTEIILTDLNNNIILRKSQKAKVITINNSIVVGTVKFIGDGRILLEDNISICFSSIKEIKAIK